MKRFSYDAHGFLEAEALVETEDGEEAVEAYAEMYAIHDCKRGHLDEKAIAFCRNRDDAELIVAALNRDAGVFA